MHLPIYFKVWQMIFLKRNRQVDYKHSCFVSTLQEERNYYQMIVYPLYTKLTIAVVAFSDMGLPSTFFKSLLIDVSPTIRIAAFDLLTFHTHQKTPLSQGCFSLIQSVLPSLFVEQDPEFRIEILRSIRGLILRIRASTHSTSKELDRNISKLGNQTAELRDILATSTNFINWLVQFCGESISPGKSFYTTSMALKTLVILAEEGFFTDLDVEVKSGVLSGVHVELFIGSMVRLMLDRLADAYDEVGRLAFWFIERIKQPDKIPWDELYETGKKLCLSGRADKSEGGAKILCLCQQFGMNIWEDVWESLIEDVKTGYKPLYGRLVALRYPPPKPN